MRMILRTRRQARPARRDRAADPRCSTRATRPTSRAAPSACAATRSTSSRPSTASWRSASSCSTTRSSRCSCSTRSPAGSGRRSRASSVYPASHYVTPREPGGRGDRDDQGRAARAARRAGQGRQAGRGAAARAAHALRPRDAAGDRPLQGHRELHAPSVGRRARRAAADAGRLPADGRADVPRREPRADRPARRHVQRRPGAQDDAGRLRLPPAVGAGQPAAEVRGVRGARCARRCSSRPRRRLRAGARRPGGRAAGAADRADRPGGRGAAGDAPGRRRAAGDPRAGRGRTSAC